MFHADVQIAAFGHGVPGVEGQIQKDLLDAGEIRLHQKFVPCGFQPNVDGFGQGAGQQIHHLLQEGQQIHRSAIHHRRPAEVQNLADEIRGVLGLLQDSRDAALVFGGQRRGAVEQLGMQNDCPH